MSGSTAGPRVRVVVSALSLVIVGAVLGIAVDRHLHRGGASGAPHELSAVERHRSAMDAMRVELELNEEQERAVDSVMREHQAALKRSWAELHEILGAAADTVHHDIEALLTPEQRAEFKEWLHRNPEGEAQRP